MSAFRTLSFSPRGLAILAAAGFAFVASGAAANDFGHGATVDVAMSGPTFFDFEEHPDPQKAAIPPNGSPFIIQGYIYPGGTFETYGNTSGVLANGMPEFPELVIGKWICRGWHLQDGDAVTGPVVATTQIFDFDPDNPGLQTIITDGLELADFDVPHKRAVTGGTGAFRQVAGEMVQTYVWDDPDFLNASGGFNTTFELRLLQAPRHVPIHLPTFLP